MQMAEKVKIGIGAPTYNSVSRLEQLLISIEFYKDTSFDYKIVILDDGTPDLNKRLEVKALANRFGVDFIQHEKNEGIPAAWNSLTNHFPDIDYMLLLNDDICLCNENWLKCAVYALDNNPKVAVIGYPLIQTDPITSLPNKNYQLPDLDSKPGRVGACVGCSFMFRKNVFLEAGMFPIWSKSFYEETFFGFEVAKRGYYSVMIPYPPIEHRGSMTFASNFELNLTKPNPEFCSMEEYVGIMSKKYPMERIIPVKDHVYRMDYSRVIFSKMLGCSDYWDKPQCEAHDRWVTPLPKINFKYLNKDLQEVECEI